MRNPTYVFEVLGQRLIISARDLYHARLLLAEQLLHAGISPFDIDSKQIQPVEVISA